MHTTFLYRRASRVVEVDERVCGCVWMRRRVRGPCNPHNGTPTLHTLTYFNVPRLSDSIPKYYVPSVFLHYLPLPLHHIQAEASAGLRRGATHMRDYTYGRLARVCTVRVYAHEEGTAKQDEARRAVESDWGASKQTGLVL